MIVLYLVIGAFFGLIFFDLTGIMVGAILGVLFYISYQLSEIKGLLLSKSDKAYSEAQ